MGKDPDLFKFRIDIQNPILAPLAFIFYQKNSHDMWNELYSDDTWLNLIKDCQLAVPESKNSGPKIHYAVADDGKGNAIECSIEADENGLPKKWHSTIGDLTADVEVKSWKKGNAMPIPSEILDTCFNKEGVLIYKITYRLKQYSQLKPALVPENTFRISSELARIIFDYDANISFSVPSPPH